MAHKVVTLEGDTEVVRRVLNVAQFSLRKLKKSEGMMFPESDRKALELIEQIIHNDPELI